MSLSRTALALGALTLGGACFALAACSDDDANPATPPAGDDDDATSSSGGAKTDGGNTPKDKKLDPLGPSFVDLGETPAEFDIDVPEGTLGFNFYPVSESGDGFPKVLEVTDPKGKTYRASDRPSSLPADLQWLVRFPAASNMLDVPAGKWHVTTDGPAFTTVAFQRTSDGKFHGGVLDLWVHIPKGLTPEDAVTGAKSPKVVDASNAAEDPIVKSVLDVFFSTAKKLLELDRGKVTFVDADAKYLSIASADQSNATGVAGPLEKDEQFGLHVLFTHYDAQDLQLGYGPYIANIGYSRTYGTVLLKVKDQIPGQDPQSYQDDGFGSGDLSGATLIHEALHAWGLPHTSEQTGPYDDAFTDTPACDAASVAADARKCPDATNMMAPFRVKPVQENVLSPHQVAVAHGVPVYRPYAP